MNVAAGLAAAAIVAAAAVGVASPAGAANDFSGTFIPNGPGLTSTWVVTPCGKDCAHIADSTGWSADARPWAGLWRFVVDLPDGTKCNNDGTAPGTVTFKVDAQRQEGTMLTTNPATWCPFALAPGYSQPVYFTLTRL
ncbi:MAG TPA: hypothetical protein VH166_10485 [Mycobacterium sp.]|nr:hypothetical protein [Mycobacterium sp.]